MARRRRSSTATKNKTSVKSAEVKTEILNGEENSSGSGSGSTEDASEEPPLVHHKKFVVVKGEGEDINETSIINGATDIPLPGEIPIFPNSTYYEERNMQGEHTVIKTESISETLKDECILGPILHQSDQLINVLRGIELLSAKPKVEAAQPKSKSENNNCASVPLESISLPPPLPDCDESQSSSPMSIDDTPSDSTSIIEQDSENSSGIRRSSRIRDIGKMKQKERVVAASPDVGDKPVKVKSRWRRSIELERNKDGTGFVTPEPQDEFCEPDHERLKREHEDEKEALATFVQLPENQYHTERNICREAKRMTCDCILSKEELESGEVGCGVDCLNRMLFLECGPRCALGDKCSNKKFQRRSYSDCKVFKTEKKGYGLRAEKHIPENCFIMEYIGEVVDQKEFARRVKAYAKDSVKHFYFMSLKGDTVIDATYKGSVSRFINHSCDPNAETQKWTVNGELRIGFFSKRPIQAGEEVTFDYRFQRYGKEAQKCFCEAKNCRGFIGENPDSDDEDESEEEEEDEEEEEEEEEEEDQGDEAVEEQEQILEKPEMKDVIQEKPEFDEMGEELSTAVQEEGSSNEVGVGIPVEQIPMPKPLKPRIRKPRAPREKKEKIKDRVRRKTEEPVVEDVGFEEELQRLTITGVKNRAHTLMVSRLMVRAEDWPTRERLLQLIRDGEEPCRRLFLDYHGLRFLHAWMVSTNTDTTDREARRLEIMKTLQALPITNKTILMDSKVLSIIEEWSGEKKHDLVNVASTILSPDGEGCESDEGKRNQRDLDDSSLDVKPSPAGSDSPDLEPKVEGLFLVSEESPKILAFAKDLLQSWSTLKEVFKIPKKERMERMKEHEREADRGYRHYLGAKERLDSLYSRYKFDRERDRDNNRDRDRDRRRTRSPSNSDPDWFQSHRRMSKHERRQLFALQVLREEEAARQRMQQEELWNQHKARCEGLGLDPNVNPAMDPMTGCPIFFDHSTRTWLPNPPFAFPPYPGFPSFPGPGPNLPPAYNMGPPMNGMPTAPIPPFPMAPWSMNGPRGPFPTPSPSVHLTPNFMPNPHFTPSNIIPLTPDPSLFDEVIPSTPEETLKPEAPLLTQVPLDVPIKLPPKWKSARDCRGYIYYYHVKERISQWLPPNWSDEDAQVEAEKVLAYEDESSSESSETDSEDDEEDDKEPGTEDATVEKTEVNEQSGGVADTTQPGGDSDGDEPSKAHSIEVRSEAEAVAVRIRSPIEMPSQSDSNTLLLGEGNDEELSGWEDDEKPPISQPPPAKKRREGLVQERLISPRRESSRPDFKRYKEAKQKIKKRREERKAEKAKAKLKAKKKRKEKKVTSAVAESSTDRKIKESFKASIAGAIVSHLNPYRKPECKIGRITNNEDFKHLARKLTHFVMVKELKHCQSVDDLQCNDSVKAKARDFVKKYMQKFGPEFRQSQE